MMDCFPIVETVTMNAISKPFKPADASCHALPTELSLLEAGQRGLQRTLHEQLQRDLRRKDRALAETAALLVLQKKFRALREDEDK